MFSSRFHWDLRPNALTERLRARLTAGEDVVDLTGSNPTSAGIVYPAEQISSALADPAALLYEPAPAGLPRAREVIAADYYGGRVDASRVLLTASTSEAYAYLIKLLADAGDELLVPRPSYPLFEFLATMESVRVSSYPLVYDSGWSIDMEALAAAVTARTRAVVVVNPNNPTGSFLKAGEFAALIELCSRLGLAIISDEVFCDYAFAPDPQRVKSLVDVEGALTFCLSGLSKVAGLPQMKLGWIVIGGRERNQALERLELIADTYLSVAAPVQHGLAGLLKAGTEIREQIRHRTRRNLDTLRRYTTDSANRTLHVEGGWCATVQMPRIRTSEEWAIELLDRHGVLVQPGYFYDFEQEALLVVSLLTPPETFEEGVRRL